ncbi:MAG: DEAD/DEAH box helicase, partial [Nanoarchaeota archaeon]
SRAIEDGYTKLPYALSRKDLDIKNLDYEDIDKLMISDGIKHHENIKTDLLTYANRNNFRYVKPFVLIVCRNTSHAEKIKNYISSNEFYNSYYQNKVLIIHSNLQGKEKESNIQLLLNVEDNENPIEIVIHVNILKEGWDVNNLYTIIPLRTAASTVLREQTIGRGLRLPYGYQTGNLNIDSLVITAHDKFEEIINEAQNPSSLLKRDRIIFSDDEEENQAMAIDSNYTLFTYSRNTNFYHNHPTIKRTKENETILESLNYKIEETIDEYNIDIRSGLMTAEEISEETNNKLKNNEDLAILNEKSKGIFQNWAVTETKKRIYEKIDNTIPIPQISVKEDNETDCYFKDFDLNLDDFKYTPIKMEIEYLNLLDPTERRLIEEKGVDFAIKDPFKSIFQEVIKEPEIDYQRDYKLIAKLIRSFIEHLHLNYNLEEIKNIVLFNKRDISNKIYNQMMLNFYKKEKATLLEEISHISTHILPHHYSAQKNKIRSLYNYNSSHSDIAINKIIFKDFKKALHPKYKFDSNPERLFAIICENDNDVEKWMRTAPRQFNLTYGNRNKKYVPDFVVESKKYYYLVEIKGEDRIEDTDVLLKKKRAIKYCEIASAYSVARQLKPWRHLFIPAKKVNISSSFESLTNKFVQDSNY